jgi:hypothetical protein
MGSRFYRLWAATSASSLGEGLGLAALPLLAAQITLDPVLVSGLTLAMTLPWLFFSLPAGVLTDRADRKELMWISSLVRAALMLTLGLAVLAGRVYLAPLYALAVLLGITNVLFDSASQAVIKGIVPSDRLEIANSRFFLTNLLGNQLVGRAAGSLLFSVAAFAPFALHGVALALSAAFTRSLEGDFRPLRSAPEATTTGGEVFEGMRWLLANPLFLATTIIAGVENLLGTACFSILVLYALEVLRIPSAGYGLLISSGALGGLLGTLVVSAIIRRLGSGGAILFAILTEGISYMGMAVPNPYVVAFMLCLHSFSNVVWGVVVLSLRQALVPDRLLGRVNSAVRLLSWGVIPFGAGLGGLIAGAFGLAAPFYLAGGIVIALGFVVLPNVNNDAVQLAREKLAG